MQAKFKSLNKIALFNDLNQGGNPLTWYLCSLYAPAINLKYNCGIKLTEEDLLIIAEKQIAKGLLKRKGGGKGIDGINAVYDYVVENSVVRGWKIPNLVSYVTNEEKKIDDWLERGYMVTVGIRANKDFLSDKKDGSLDLYEDYNKYKGTDLLHFTNITRWKDRFYGSKGLDYNSEQFIDSYAYNKKGNKWIYKCDIKKVLKTFVMRTKYVFF